MARRFPADSLPRRRAGAVHGFSFVLRAMGSEWRRSAQADVLWDTGQGPDDPCDTSINFDVGK